MGLSTSHPLAYFSIILHGTSNHIEQVVGHQNDRADGPAPRPDGPRPRRSALVVRTVRARAESVRVSSF
jgi:hypothetical protein